MRTLSSLDLYATFFRFLHVLVLRKCTSFKTTAARTLTRRGDNSGLYPQNFQKAWFTGTYVPCMWKTDSRYINSKKGGVDWCRLTCCLTTITVSSDKMAFWIFTITGSWWTRLSNFVSPDARSMFKSLYIVMEVEDNCNSINNRMISAIPALRQEHPFLNFPLNWRGNDVTWFESQRYF